MQIPLRRAPAFQSRKVLQEPSRFPVTPCLIPSTLWVAAESAVASFKKRSVPGDKAKEQAQLAGTLLHSMASQPGEIPEGGGCFMGVSPPPRAKKAYVESRRRLEANAYVSIKEIASVAKPKAEPGAIFVDKKGFDLLGTVGGREGSG